MLFYWGQGSNNVAEHTQDHSEWFGVRIYFISFHVTELQCPCFTELWIVTNSETNWFTTMSPVFLCELSPMLRIFVRQCQRISESLHDFTWFAFLWTSGTCPSSRGGCWGLRRRWSRKSVWRSARWSQDQDRALTASRGTWNTSSAAVLALLR